MCLLISNIFEAQETITSQLLEVSRTHSVQSVSSLTDKLDYLRTYGDGKFDVVILCAGQYGSSGQIEFGLKWVFKEGNGENPMEKEPWMVGGLIYHTHTGEWGVHT